MRDTSPRQPPGKAKQRRKKDKGTDRQIGKVAAAINVSSQQLCGTLTRGGGCCAWRTKLDYHGRTSGHNAQKIPCKHHGAHAGENAHLAKEAGGDTVKDVAPVTNTLLVGAQRPKVFTRKGRVVEVQFYFHASELLSVMNHEPKR